MSLINKVEQFNRDSDIAHQIVHGDAETIVETDGGPVRSFAKLIDDKDKEFVGGNVVQQAVSAKNEAVLAKNTAIAARDAAIVNSKTYATEVAGRAAVADGEYFKVAGSGSVAASEYKRVNSTTSTLVAQYPSSAYVIVKDSLRAAVEAASGGRTTVLYTAAGNPSYMHILPAFNCEDIAPGGELGTGLYPAFIVNGVNKSELFIGAYQASMIGAEAVSLPAVPPRASINFNSARAACVAAGTGWHLMTNWEWAAIALWCMANGFEPRGNTNYGRHHVNRIETGRKVNGGIPGDTATSRPNLTGSGPASWAHDGTVGGIHDLVGNVWEWNDGLQLQDGRVFMPVDNNYLADEADWVAHDLWFSGSHSDKTGTLGLATSEAEVIRNGELGSDVTSGFSDSQTWSNIAVSGDAPLATKQALIAPSILKPTGKAYARTYGARFPSRGGGWSNGGDAGLGALNFNGSRVSAFTSIGFRPAFAL
ncbi:MAG: formylglycine-generating enzyme family protein [Alcaligenaceae bacterium]|nr:formylglycine-generating enzyme family protein [Alcaligenaceae bacterium]